MDACERHSTDFKRRTVIAADALDVSAHHGQRFDDPLHGALLDRFVTGQRYIKILRSENAGDESRCRSGISAVKRPGRGGQPVHALSVDDDGTVFIFNLDPHAAETADGRKAVSAL